MTDRYLRLFHLKRIALHAQHFCFAFQIVISRKWADQYVNLELVRDIMFISTKRIQIIIKKVKEERRN